MQLQGGETREWYRNKTEPCIQETEAKFQVQNVWEASTDEIPTSEQLKVSQNESIWSVINLVGGASQGTAVTLTWVRDLNTPTF